MRIPVTLKSSDAEYTTKALVDSGAGGKFIDQKLVEKLKLPRSKLTKPIPVFNVDGTPNLLGAITHTTTLTMEIGGEELEEQLMITSLGKHDVILGLTWLQERNPIIDWAEGTLRLRKKLRLQPRTQGRVMINRIEAEPFDPHTRIPTDEDDYVLAYLPGTEYVVIQERNGRTAEEVIEEMWVNAKINQAMAMAQQGGQSQTLLPDELKQFSELFEKKASERFPESRPWDHAIELKEGFIPRDCQIYPTAPAEDGALKEFVETNLGKGYIRPSKSPMTSPFFFVGKKDGALRPCQDYRYLNENTVENRYPIPNTNDVIDDLIGSRIFTKLDLRSGYNNVRIRDGDQWKAAFKTKYGTFEPTVMFFGLCNSPATFQNMMDDIFKEEVAEGWLRIYMDDMIIHSEDRATHMTRTKRVLQKLRDNDLFLNLNKCHFNQDKVEYLGMIISHNHVEMDPVKVKGVMEWPRPTTVKQVRGFLGFANFYRKFIPKFSDIARPLNDLTKKDHVFDWTEECEHAFEDLKKKFTEEPILLMPDKTKPFELECDASLHAIGAVLRQRDGNGELHPVAYMSKSLSPTERNYDIYDRELLAIVEAFKEYHKYFYGAPHPIAVCTDHQNLTYFRTPQKLNRRQARWYVTSSSIDSPFSTSLVQQ